MYIQIARWCNQPNFFKKKSFRQFCEANQDYHKNPNTNCASYQALIDFQAKHPKIANKYFDIRYDEQNQYNNSFGYGRKYAHKNDCDVCAIEQKKWLDAYYGVLEEEMVLKNYFIQEMDLQCLIYQNGHCNEVLSDDIADWFIEILLKNSPEKIIELIKNEEFENILPSNIPQFSKFNDAIFDVVNILGNMKEQIRFEDLGYYLDGKNKSLIAKKKYGENHSKFATLLDLVAIINKSNVNYIELSVLGKSYNKLNKEDKLNLVVNLSLRIPIVQNVLSNAFDSKVNLTDYMEILSEKTLKRRQSNVTELFQFIKENSNDKLDNIFDNIKGV